MENKKKREGGFAVFWVVSLSLSLSTGLCLHHHLLLHHHPHSEGIQSCWWPTREKGMMNSNLDGRHKLLFSLPFIMNHTNSKVRKRESPRLGDKTHLYVVLPQQLIGKATQRRINLSISFFIFTYLCGGGRRLARHVTSSVTDALHCIALLCICLCLIHHHPSSRTTERVHLSLHFLSLRIRF